MSVAHRLQSVLARGAPLQVALGSSAARAVGALLGFAATFIATAVLGAANAGVLYGTIAWVGALSILSRWGAMDRILVAVSPLVGTWREKSIPAMINADVIATLARGAILLVLVGLGLLGLAAIDQGPVLSLGLMAVLLPATAVLTLLAATSKGLGDARRAIQFEFIIPPAIVLIVAGFARSGVFPDGLWTIGGAYVAGTVLAAALCFVVLLAKRWHGRRSARTGKRFARKDRNFAVIEFAAFLNIWLALLLLPLLLTASDVGIFNLAFRLATAVVLISATVSAVLTPQLAQRLRRKDQAGWQSTVRQGRWLAVAIALGFIAVIYVAGPTILRWAGEEFAAGLVPLYILTMCFAAGIAMGPVESILYAAGRESLVRNANIAMTAISLAVMVAAISMFGTVGAALVSGLSWVILKAILLYLEIGVQRRLEWA